jgi:hypothetical protein
MDTTMSEAFVENCPLCASVAEYWLADAGNRKTFNCVNCTEFQISKDAQKKVVNVSDDVRKLLADRARRHPEAQALVILKPRNDSERFHIEYVDVDYLSR